MLYLSFSHGYWFLDVNISPVRWNKLNDLFVHTVGGDLSYIHKYIYMYIIAFERDTKMSPWHWQIYPAKCFICTCTYIHHTFVVKQTLGDFTLMTTLYLNFKKREGFTIRWQVITRSTCWSLSTPRTYLPVTGVHWGIQTVTLPVKQWWVHFMPRGDRKFWDSTTGRKTMVSLFPWDFLPPRGSLF